MRLRESRMGFERVLTRTGYYERWARLTATKYYRGVQTRSPSAGIIRDYLTVTEIVLATTRGACSISILTDEEFLVVRSSISRTRSQTTCRFCAKISSSIPLQIFEAAICWTDAVLLIVRPHLDDACCASKDAVALLPRTLLPP